MPHLRPLLALLLLALFASSSAPGQEPAGLLLNARDFGAKGDGVADDTAALQAALVALSQPGAPGELWIPAGTYRITRTLLLEAQQGRTIRGAGCTKFEPQPARGAQVTLLAWDGPPGGVLLETVGIGGCSFERLNLAGVLPAKRKELLQRNQPVPQAGILYLGRSGRGYGNMLNRLTAMTFFHADVGLQMARDQGEVCASDMLLQNLTLVTLGTGFKVVNDQGVNYLFNFLFATECDRVLHFERGGQVLVQNAQITCCGLFLDIGGGGRCNGVFLCQNVHLEGAGRRGAEQRWRLLRVAPHWEQVNVGFTGFVDAQWYWAKNQSATRELPLCEIGPGASVTFQNSIFNSPVAQVTGAAGKPATLVVRDSSFGYVSPLKGAFAANAHGYVRTRNCRDDHANPANPVSLLPDFSKWPDLPPVRLEAQGELKLDTAGIVW